MNHVVRIIVAFMLMAGLLALVGVAQSWSLALTILNLCLISAIMSLGVNIQWGFAGLFNIGIMGFAALGGLAVVLVAQPPIAAAWRVGGLGLLFALLCLCLTIAAVVGLRRYLRRGKLRTACVSVVILGGIFATQHFFNPATAAVEAVEPSRYGYLGGLGLPVLLSWLVGGAFAAGAAWFIGKIALGLRADYLAIATLGISEIIIAVLKNEEWLSRGVKNVTDIPRPIPYEIELQTTPWFIDWIGKLHATKLQTLPDAARGELLRELVVQYSGLWVKLCYTGLFLSVLIVFVILSSAALHSPWGRMMRALRDNEVSASAMGKDIAARHLQVFVLGSAVVGVAGAMLVTLDGQFTPGTYTPLRYTFLIWVMLIVGGSGSNAGAVIGGFLIWFLWVEAEPVGLWLAQHLTFWLGDHPLRAHILANAQHMRLLLMGAILLLVMRFSPAGLLPAKELQRSGVR